MNVRPLPVVALLVSLIPLASCGPRLKPRYDPTWGCFDHPESSPIIVVARIEPGAVSFAGRTFTDNSIPAGPIRMFKVRVFVEDVVKGDAPRGDVDIFYFGSVTGATGDIAFFVAKTFRTMLLLRREEGRLRMAEDITSDCEAAVYSGVHPNPEPRGGETLREKMIDILLTPGAGVTDLGMIRAIFDLTPPEISPDYTAKTLLKLATLPSPVIRTAACLEFRDLLAEKGSALSDQFGVSKPDLKRWREQEQQNTRARFWWAHGPLSWAVPTTPLPVGNLTGLSLCTNDKALRVPPLRPKPSPDSDPMQTLLNKLTKPSAPTRR